MKNTVRLFAVHRTQKNVDHVMHVFLLKKNVKFARKVGKFVPMALPFLFHDDEERKVKIRNCANIKAIALKVLATCL